MNRYPVWKYVILLIAMVVGGVYALPNFFGESPAVQVSSTKPLVKVDAGTLVQVEAALKRAAREFGIAPWEEGPGLAQGALGATGRGVAEA